MYATEALNLSVRGCGPLTSFPVSDRSVTRWEYEGPKAPYRRLLFSLVAWQQNGRTVRSGRSHLSSLSLGGGGGGGKCSLLDRGPMLVPMSFLFIIVPIPFLVGPFVLSRMFPMFRPQEKKSARCCHFESLSDSGFIAPNLAFYRPYKAQLDI